MPDQLTLGSPRRSAAISGLIHAAVIALVLLVSTAKHSPLATFLPVSDTRVYLPRTVHLHLEGGGGQHSPLPVPKGQPPKAAPRVFTPPHSIAENMPLLPMPPTILAGTETSPPAIDLAHIGVPTGQLGPFSGGPGKGGGLGDGDGPAMGDGTGPGPGGNGDSSYGVVTLPRKGATKPVLLTKTEPEYSDEARKSKLQGIVTLSIVVTATGQVTGIEVVRNLGLGLDEKAIDAVRHWQFRAATVHGKPVATRAIVEVNFRLL